ncbi:MAG: VWA domain-containing protein [Leptolyngbya sp. PLA3]|nr:MAG: VWA domain-containing protein [Cyanobacteria bacterium CYA]MCE7968302.1 VWA domain-containing protein [Leptolyngbya sp. PL-A3]
MDRFAWPWVFVLLVAVPLVLWRPGRARLGGAMHTRYDLLADVGCSWRTRLTWLPPVLRGVCLTLCVSALARPQESQGSVRSSMEGVAIQLVVDRSSSMEAQMSYAGGQTSRIEVVKQVVREFIEGEPSEPTTSRAGDMIGLIAFARYADTVCPLVRTHAALVELLEQVETAPRGSSEDGTGIGAAIALAAARLKNAEAELQRSIDRSSDAAPEFKIASKVIVLLTDGVENQNVSPIEAARLAGEWGIRIYAIGIGDTPREQRSIFDLGAPQVDTRLLEEMARMTDGQYFSASDADSLRQVYQRIGDLEKTRIESAQFIDYRELYRQPLIGALLALSLEVVLSTLLLRRSA